MDRSSQSSSERTRSYVFSDSDDSRSGHFSKDEQKGDIELYVDGLPYDIHTNNVKKFFEEYGNVTRVAILKGYKKMSYGFVHFSNWQIAEKAIEELNGAKVGDNIITVCLSNRTRNAMKKQIKPCIDQNKSKKKPTENRRRKISCMKINDSGTNYNSKSDKSRGKSVKKIRCYLCSGWGHKSYYCANKVKCEQQG